MRRTLLRSPRVRARSAELAEIAPPYGGLARVFAELSGRTEVWTKGLEGWNVEVSQVVLEWQAQALARGLAQGRAEGRDEVRAEMLELLRENVLELLRTKSQTDLPADLVAAVQGQNDPAMLRQWFDRVLKAASLEEVQSAFRLV